MVRTTKSHKPLPIASLNILLSLRDGEAHGYAIMQSVERLTGGAMKMGPGTLYGGIKRLLAEGMIAESGERPDPQVDDQRRRYYRITAQGEMVMAGELERLAGTLRAAGWKVAGPTPRPGMSGA